MGASVAKDRTSPPGRSAHLRWAARTEREAAGAGGRVRPGRTGTAWDRVRLVRRVGRSGGVRQAAPGLRARIVAPSLDVLHHGAGDGLADGDEPSPEPCPAR